MSSNGGVRRRSGFPGQYGEDCLPAGVWLFWVSAWIAGQMVLVVRLVRVPVPGRGS